MAKIYNIPVKDIKNLIQLYRKHQDPPVTETTIYALTNLINNCDESKEICLTDMNQYIASKLWTIEDYVKIATEELNVIPHELRGKLPIYKDLETIAKNATKNHRKNELTDCTTEEWDCIRHAIQTEMKTSDKYNPYKKAKIKITYPNKDIEIHDAQCNELTHEVTCYFITHLFNDIITCAKIDPSLYKLKVCKDEKEYPLFHCSSFSNKFLTQFSEKELATIYYIR